MFKKRRFQWSIKEKIIISFSVSFSLINLLGILAYIDFIKIMDDIRYLETTDRMRGKILEMRRYEKNFLNGDVNAQEKVRQYSSEIAAIARSEQDFEGRDGALDEIETLLGRYNETFDEVAGISAIISKGLDSLLYNGTEVLILTRYSYLEHPIQTAAVLKKTLQIKNNKIITLLLTIDKKVKDLRGIGEELISCSEGLDRTARIRIERLLNVSKISAIILIPSSFIIGIALLFLVSQRVVNRLKELAKTMDKMGNGYFAHIEISDRHDETDKLNAAFNHMSDMLRHREELLQEKDDELQRSRHMAAIGTLASGVAHELNNPLNNMNLAAQTLKRAISKNDYPEIFMDSIGDIQTQTQRMKTIVGDLLEFSRNKQPEYVQIELNGLLNEIYRKIAAANDIDGIDFSIDGTGYIFAGRPQIEQVFVNLINNAIDAVSLKGEIKVIIAQTGSEMEIRVRDNGPGIPEESISRIFEPFFTKKEKGTGLGLFITYNLINKHNGSIRAESIPTGGTEFIVTLPIVDMA